MSNKSQDWRETEQRLRDLPDHELRQALAEAGVKAVLPSDRKPRGRVKPAGAVGESTTRWANGDWQERISLEGLPDAQKFLDDPLKPPTVAVPKGAALSSPSPARRPLGGVLVGMAATALVLGLLVYAVRDQAFLDRPRVEARGPAPASEAADTAAQAVAAAAAALEAPELPASSEDAPAAALAEGVKSPAAAPQAAGPARPAGSPSAHDDREAREVEDRRLRFLSNQARKGDVPSMITLARALVDRGDANAAMKWAGRAKLKRRSSIEARIVLGDAQMLAGYGKAAEDTWRGALARAPRNKDLLQRLGED